jgi:hypothetical protein
MKESSCRDILYKKDGGFNARDFGSDSGARAVRLQHRNRLVGLPGYDVFIWGNPVLHVPKFLSFFGEHHTGTGTGTGNEARNESVSNPLTKL